MSGQRVVVLPSHISCLVGVSYSTITLMKNIIESVLLIAFLWLLVRRRALPRTYRAILNFLAPYLSEELVNFLEDGPI